MIFKKFDFISPQITLYFKGNTIHPSIFSGIVTIISYLIILAYGIFNTLSFIYKKDPKIYFFTRYIEDAGTFPLNASSMFHFIQMVTTDDNKYHPIDFDAVRFIGIEETIDNYMNITNLYDYNHWVYGPCDNKTDTKGIGHLITQDYFEQSACIKKYYNSKDKLYYNQNDINFKWPIILKGCSNPNRTFYGVIMEKCKNDTYKNDCKSTNKINEYIKHSSVVFQLMNQYADILNYKSTFIKMFYSVSTGLFDNSITVNHFNFNPAMSITHKGIFFDLQNGEKSYVFTQNDKIIMDNNSNNNVLVGFYFWMQNNMQYFDRTFTKFQDLLSDIGGFSSLILGIAININTLANNYTILLDTEELILNSHKRNFNANNLKSRPTFLGQINELNPPKKIKSYKSRNNKEQQQSSIDEIKQSRGSSQISHEEEPKCFSFKILANSNNKNCCINQTEIKKNMNMEISNIKNQPNEIRTRKKSNTFRNNPIERPNLSDIITTKEEKLYKPLKKQNFVFRSYLLYFVRCKSKNKKINYYENIRSQFISEENIIQNHLDIYQLLTIHKIKKQNPLNLINYDEEIIC